MDPILAGLLANIAYDSLKGGVKLPFETTLNDRIRNAAEDTAESHDALDADDLIEVMKSESIDEQVTVFKRSGQPLSTAEIATEFEKRAVTKFLDDDAETVVEEFLTSIERELTADPDLFRQLLLQYIKNQKQGIEELQTAIESLNQDASDLSNIPDPTLLADTVDHLNNQGFEWLTTADFEEGKCDPERCWRRPFTFAEIGQGLAIQRERNIKNGKRVSVTNEIVDTLTDGGAQILIGRAGTGKSTVCKSVAHHWHTSTDRGVVLYREGGSVNFDSQTTLSKAIDLARNEEEGGVLVVAEDVDRRDVRPVLSILEKYETDSTVSFLLEARKSAWSPESALSGESPQTTIDRRLIDLRKSLPTYEMPELDAKEIGRIIEKFQKNTDKNVRLSAKELHDRIQSVNSTETSALLLLSYYLPVGDATDGVDRNKSPLTTNVRGAHSLVTNPGSKIYKSTEIKPKLVRKLALLLNIMNAAGLDIRRELLHSISRSEDEHLTIDQCIEALEGELIFTTDNEMRYLSHHPVWSLYYLNLHAKQSASNAAAKQLFTDCVQNLLSFIDNKSSREQTRLYLGKTTLFDDIQKNTDSYADSFVTDICNIVNERPDLAPLFPVPEKSSGTFTWFPDQCSKPVKTRCVLTLAGAYQNHDIEIARTLSGRAEEIIEMINDTKRRNECRLQLLSHRGSNAMRVHDYESAEETIQKMLSLSCETNNKSLEISSWQFLGMINYVRGDYGDAIN